MSTSSPTPREPAESPSGADLDFALARLGRRLKGELRRDLTHRHLYATDASIYAEQPVGVAFPKSESDLLELMRFGATAGLPLVARAAGTSLAGQVVGSGLIVDVGKHLTEIVDLDVEGRRVRLQPGVIQDELNRVLAPHGLVFGPDTSTGNRAMIGGMIGNNSCGSRSIRYGTTRDHILAARVLLADGTTAELEDWDRPRIEEVAARDDRLGRIVRGLEAIVRENQAHIEARYPPSDIRRRNTGYALDYLASTQLVDPAGPPLNLARFLCGSEGTLALVSEATLNLERRPVAAGMVVAHFDTLSKALEATRLAVSLEPSAVELVDRPILRLTETQLAQRKNRFFLEGDPEAILIVEFFRDSQEEVEAVKRRLMEELDNELSYACVEIAAPDQPRVWSLRKAGLGLLMGIPGDAKPVAFVEDTAVRVEDLPEFTDRFDAIMVEHEVDCVHYGHASVGELHLRPVLDLKRPEAVEKLRAIGLDVAQLVAEYRGSLSGEHGDGRVRSPFIGDVMGPELTRAFEKVKRLWDPDGLLNPGKIVDPKPIEADLRTQVGAPTPQIDTHFAFDVDDGLARHVERCNGAGVCRKLIGAGGVMCPSYMATRDELHTTRGRANLFRQLLQTRDPRHAMASQELYEALELCLACKSCKSECPASVDMAKLKAEFLQHYWDQHGVPARALAVGQVATLNRLGGKLPGLSNRILRGGVLGRVTKWVMGVHPKRQLPALAKQSFGAWWRGRRGATQGHGSKVVALYVDEFTDANAPEIGRAAVDVLEAMGFEVVVPRAVESGRPLVSKGLLRQARRKAVANIRALWPLADEGVPILGLEPSAALTLVDEYPELVPAGLRERAGQVAGQTQLFTDFVAREAKARGELADLFDDEERTLHYHGHCHEKALVGVEGALAALALPKNHRVTLIESTCCGMAGSFGYEHYDLSMQIGELALFPAVRQTQGSDLIVTQGFSCRHQIEDGTGRGALHPAQVLRLALRA